MLVLASFLYNNLQSDSITLIKSRGNHGRKSQQLQIWLEHIRRKLERIQQAQNRFLEQSYRDLEKTPGAIALNPLFNEAFECSEPYGECLSPASHEDSLCR